MVRQNRSQLHHYVSEFHLKLFTIPEPSRHAGTLWRFERGSTLPKPVPPRRAAAEIDYNTVTFGNGEKSDLFEKNLVPLETAVTRVIRAAIDKETRALTNAERMIMAFYIAVAMLRVPKSRQFWEKMHADIEEQRMQVLARTPGELERLMAELEAKSGEKSKATAQQVREFFVKRKYKIKVTPIVSLQILLSQAPQLTPILAHMRWVILTTQSEERFFMSDNPVVYVDPTNRPGAWGVALLDERIELTFPISSRRCLLATHDPVLRDNVVSAAALSQKQLVKEIFLAYRPHMSYKVATDDIIHEINRRTMHGATRWLFSCTDNVAVRKLVGEHFAAPLEKPDVTNAP